MKSVLSIITILLIYNVSNAQIKAFTTCAKSSNTYTFPDLTGKTAIAVGNSITQGVGASYLYVNYLQDSTKLDTVINKGVSGNTMTKNIYRDGFRAQVTQSYGNDLIFIWGGTNDWFFNIEVGDTTSHNDSTYCGAVNYFIDLINQNSPQSILIFILTTSRTKDQQGNIITTHPVNSLGLTANDYGLAITPILDRRGILYYSLWELPGLTINSPDWLADGLHLNNTGHARVGEYLKLFITNH